MAIMAAEGNAVIYADNVVNVEYDTGTRPGSLVQLLPVFYGYITII
jgi:hypothetical protein